MLVLLPKVPLILGPLGLSKLLVAHRELGELKLARLKILKNSARNDTLVLSVSPNGIVFTSEMSVINRPGPATEPLARLPI